MDLKLFRLIENKYGYVASWALWKPADDKPKSNMSDMDILNPDKNKDLLSSIKTNIVMVGLNFSRNVKFDKPFQNFHDKSPHANDFKIRYAFDNTPYYGTYMTDIIKNLEMVSSKDVLTYLKNNPSVIKQNISCFKEELQTIKSNKPILLAFGSDSYRLLKDNLDSSFYTYLIKLIHYSHQISKEDYKREVHKQIAEGFK